MAYTLDDPLQMANGLVLEASGQLAVLPVTDVVKESASRSPSYRFGGWC